MTEPTTIVATCRTEGCANAGAGIPIATRVPDALTGELVDAAAQVWCGVCGNPITDLAPEETST